MRRRSVWRARVRGKERLDPGDRHQAAVSSLLELIGGAGAQIFLRPRPLTDYMLGVRTWMAIHMELQDRRLTGEISADIALPTTARITNAVALAALQRQIADAAAEHSTKLALAINIDAEALSTFVMSLRALAAYSEMLLAEDRFGSEVDPETMALLHELAAELEDVAAGAPEMDASVDRYEPLFIGADAAFTLPEVPLCAFTAAGRDFAATSMDLQAQVMLGNLSAAILPPRPSRLVIGLVWAVTQFQVVDAARLGKRSFEFGLPLDRKRAAMFSSGFATWRAGADELVDRGLCEPSSQEVEAVFDAMLLGCETHAVSGE